MKSSILIQSSFLAIVATLSIADYCKSQYIGADSPVGVPSFHFRNGKTGQAGRAFAIQWTRGRKILLCPLHVVGTDGGSPPQIEVKDVGNRVSFVEVLDLKRENTIARGGRALLKDGVAAANNVQAGLNLDMVAFDLESHNHMPVLGLSGKLVPIGTKVWVLSKDINATDTAAERFPGKISESRETAIVVTMDRPLTALASSGAPVVNDRNEVVGMVIGSMGTDRMGAFALPSTAIYYKLIKDIGL